MNPFKMELNGNLEWIKFAIIAGGILSIGIANIKSIPRLQDKVEQHEVKIAVMENNIVSIKQGVELLVRRREDALTNSDN